MKKLFYPNQTSEAKFAMGGIAYGGRRPLATTMLVFALCILAGHSVHSQTFTTINAPTTLVSCTTQDTLGITVLNNSGAAVTNIRIVPQ